MTEPKNPYLASRAGVEAALGEAWKQQLRFAEELAARFDMPVQDRESFANDWRASMTIEKLWKAADFSTPEALEASLRPASRGQIALYAMSYSHADICNGGFHQYFANHTGALAREALDGFRLVGLDQHADLLTRAMSRFPDGVAPRDWGLRNAILDAFDYESDWKPFIEPIEDAYYALCRVGSSDDPMTRAFDAYIATHPAEFFADDE